VRHERVHVRFDTSIRIVNLEVLPVGSSGGRGFLVFFEDSDRQYFPPDVTRVVSAGNLSAGDEVARLTQELRAAREYMQSLIEHHEASNESCKQPMRRSSPQIKSCKA
jgi:two-component system, chemotaxis family, CheB/CheR fusion protein